MLNYDLKTIAQLTAGKLIGNTLTIQSISTNSKAISPHTLFISIKGERLDGHDFIEDAIDHGAIAVLSEKKLNIDIPYILVANTRLALGQIAADTRKTFSNPVIGLTGSMGKTTTKAMIAAILSQHYRVLSPESSMNNDIGLPLTLLQLSDQDFAIVEMGTNHPGEIDYLTILAKPDVALITNIGSAHLEAFKNLSNVAIEKSSIFKGLNKDGVAVVNADDPYSKKFNPLLPTQKMISFGYAQSADVRATDIHLNVIGQAQFILSSKDFSGEIHLQCFGEHNVKNALAAAAIALHFKIPFKDIKAGLESLSPVSKRLKRRKGLNGSTIIDDSYSAIPDAVIAALNVLACNKGKKLFIFGGMAELNPDQKISLHREIGLKAKAVGVDTVLTIGELSKHTSHEFGKTAHHFDDKQSLIAYAKTLLQPDVTVLVKGSRGMRLEDVVNEIIET